jgi:hypothetical protein
MSASFSEVFLPKERPGVFQAFPRVGDQALHCGMTFSHTCRDVLHDTRLPESFQGRRIVQVEHPGELYEEKVRKASHVRVGSEMRVFHFPDERI